MGYFGSKRKSKRTVVGAFAAGNSKTEKDINKFFNEMYQRLWNEKRKVIVDEFFVASPLRVSPRKPRNYFVRLYGNLRNWFWKHLEIR